MHRLGMEVGAEKRLRAEAVLPSQSDLVQEQTARTSGRQSFCDFPEMKTISDQVRS